MKADFDLEGSEEARASDLAVLELSVVMPCLNEADTLATCIIKARRAMEGNGISGEVIVADNGSTDDSISIAMRHGARVVSVKEPGYGSALIGGIRQAKSRFVVMGDADDSYDFGEIPKFVADLRQGSELVQGCRLPSGGGTVKKGAMPFLHRWFGNPVLSWLARLMFKVPVTDIYCGMRGFHTSLFDRLNLRCTGMEFATEMIIKCALQKAKITEVPITLHPDGRKSHPPHLRTFRDGWRTLRFFLLFSPRWLFLYPSLTLIGSGTALLLLGFFQERLGGVELNVHSMIVGSLFALVGVQCLLFALVARVFATKEGLLPADPAVERFFRFAKLELGCVLGLVLATLGAMIIGIVAFHWRSTGFSALEYSVFTRWVVLGMFLSAIGSQGIISSFFISALGIPLISRRDGRTNPEEKERAQERGRHQAEIGNEPWQRPPTILPSEPRIPLH